GRSWSFKNPGFDGEVWLGASREAEEIASSRPGSGGTMVGSFTGSGGAGGRAGVAGAAVEVGGGAGRATGGVFFPHAMVPTQIAAHTITPSRRFIACSPLACSPNGRSIRPVGFFVVADPGDLFQVPAVARNR